MENSGLARKAVSFYSHEDFLYKGTVIRKENMDAVASAAVLRDALRGRRRAADVPQELASHTNDQRQSIRRHYRLLTGKELDADIEDQLGGYLSDISLKLLQEPIDFLTSNLHSYIKDVGLPTSTLIELLFGLSKYEIQKLKETFQKKYGGDVEKITEKEMNGDVQILMKILLSTERSESVDINEVNRSAQVLATAGVGRKYGSADPVIISVLQSQSYDEIRQIFVVYTKMSGNTIEDQIIKECEGTLKEALIHYVTCIKNPLAFYATQLHYNSTNYENLIRLIIARSEIDLQGIKNMYLQIYGSKLGDMIKDNYSGDCCRCILQLLGYNC